MRLSVLLGENAYRLALCSQSELEKRESALREAQERTDRTKGRLAQLEQSVGDGVAVDIRALREEHAASEAALRDFVLAL